MKIARFGTQLLLKQFEIYRTMSTLPKVFVRHIDSEDKMKINFTFGMSDFPALNLGFIRGKDETLEATVSRMKRKIQDSISKKISNKKKKKGEDFDVGQIPISFSIFNNDGVLNMDVKNGDAWNANHRMKINEVTYEIIENPPTVLHLSLPKHIMAGFPVYPKVLLEFCSKEECVFTWYKSLTKSEKETLQERDQIVTIKNEKWLKVSNGFFYVTSPEDVGRRLCIACSPKSDTNEGIEEDSISLNSIQLGPKKCPFEDRHEYTREITKSDQIRCVSYNILADLYADTDTARNDLFPYCPTEALTLDYRKQLYLKEIIGYNADIICLQEVDRKVFTDDLVPVLSSTGLNGLYDEKGGQVVEGLACFYRTDKFKVIANQAIILCDALKTEKVLEPLFQKVNENEKLKERIMKRTTALQIVLLESLCVPKKKILIGNTHLYFHPDSDNIRLIQGAASIMFLEHLLQGYQQQDPSYEVSAFLSGDFNSCPEFGVYQLMTKGYVAEDCVDWKSNPEEEVTGMPLRHSLTLSSACGTPRYTNYTEGFVGCLDYMFFDESKLKVTEVVPFPTHDQVIQHTALPNKEFPSDHIALVCTLKWNK